MATMFTYRTAARRVGRHHINIRSWRRKYQMKVTVDPVTHEVLIAEPELMRCYRQAIGRNCNMTHRRRQALQQATLPGLGFDEWPDVLD